MALRLFWGRQDGALPSIRTTVERSLWRLILFGRIAAKPLEKSVHVNCTERLDAHTAVSADSFRHIPA